MYGYERTTAMSAVGSGSVWLLVGSGGMDYATIARDYIYRDYHRDPFPRCLLRTRQSRIECSRNLDGAIAREYMGTIIGIHSAIP